MTWAYFTQNMGEMQARHLLPRYAERALARKLETFPVVVARHLRAFMSDHPMASAGLLLHRGQDLFRLERGVLAAPWWRVV